MADDQFKARVDLLEKSGYLKNFSNMAMAMCAPFWWSGHADGEPPVILGNGTICYVNTGQRHIGITAYHVYAEYMQNKAQHPNVECQLGGSTFVPEKYLIDQDVTLDLATFAISDVFVASSFGHYHHNALTWPPPLITTSDVVLYGGYPQVLREPKGGKVDFPFQYFVGKVSGVEPKRLVLDPRLEYLYWPGHEGEQINTQWGGHSGGPVFRVVDANPTKGEVVDRLELIGFIYQKWMDVMLARPAHVVRADGTLEKG